MITETATRYVGPIAGDLVQILLVTSLFAALLSFHNVLSRYIFSLGNTRRLPARCGRSHAEHDSPHVASVVQTVSALVLVVASALAGLDPVTEVFAWFAGAASVGIVALMTLTSAAVLVFFRRTRIDRRPWNTVIAPTPRPDRARRPAVHDRRQPAAARRRVRHPRRPSSAPCWSARSLGGAVVALLRPHAARHH